MKFIDKQKFSIFVLSTLLFLSLLSLSNNIKSVHAQSNDFGNIKDLSRRPFWSYIKQHMIWDLEYYNGITWLSIKSALKIIVTMYDNSSGIPDITDYSEATFCKIMLNFTAPYSANYRLTFAVDINIKNHIYNNGSYRYILTYQNYTLFFDWSDLKNVSGLIFSHGVKDIINENWFWFRIQRNNIPIGYKISLDPIFGDTNTYSTAFSSLYYVHGIKAMCTESGTAQSLRILQRFVGDVKGKGALYKYSDKSLVGETEERIFTTNTTLGWYTYNFLETPSITAQDYIIVMWFNDSDYRTYYTTTIGYYYEYYIKTYDSFNNLATFTEISGYSFSMYCVYDTGVQKTWNHSETWKINLYNYTWHYSEIWLLYLYNYSWFNVEIWLLHLYNYSWHSIEIWHIVFSNLTWYNVETWLLHLYSFSWHNVEIWLLHLYNYSWNPIEIWKITLGYGYWYLAEIWLTHILTSAISMNTTILFSILAIMVSLFAVVLALERKREKQ